jgi:carbonic anhydrase
MAEDGLVHGWSMQEALVAAQKESAKMANMTPRDVLQSLQRGNMRFYSGHASRPEKSAFHRRALISTQFPSTAVLGCADSRVPVEIVFDQGTVASVNPSANGTVGLGLFTLCYFLLISISLIGPALCHTIGLGDMFVVRVAGNCLGVSTEASLQYAIHHLSVKVVLVLGHEGCGAIKAAGLPLEQIDKEPDALASVLKSLKSGLANATHIDKMLDARARDREAVTTNVKNQVVKLTEDPGILAKVDSGKIKMVGCYYEISSGIVDFFMQVAQEEPGEAFKPSPGIMSRYNPKTKEIVYA